MSKKKQKQQHRDDDKQQELPEQAREVGLEHAHDPRSHRSLQSLKEAGDNADAGEPQPGYTGVHDMYPGGSRG
jgi:hypothetical protein